MGRHSARRVSYGRSLVVDPWGRVALDLGGVKGDHEDDWEAEDGAIGQLGLVDIELAEWARVREKMPLVRRTYVEIDALVFPFGERGGLGPPSHSTWKNKTLRRESRLTLDRDIYSDI